MDDFNLNINNDIPEEYAFRDEYMLQGLDIYDQLKAEKEFPFKEEYMIQGLEIYEQLKAEKEFPFKEEYMVRGLEIYEELKLEQEYAFKEEYMAQGLEIYQNLKQKKERRKRILYFSSVAAVLVLAFTFSYLPSNLTLSKNESPDTNTPTATSETGKTRKSEAPKNITAQVPSKKSTNAVALPDRANRPIRIDKTTKTSNETGTNDFQADINAAINNQKLSDIPNTGEKPQEVAESGQIQKTGTDNSGNDVSQNTSPDNTSNIAQLPSSNEVIDKLPIRAINFDEFSSTNSEQNISPVSDRAKFKFLHIVKPHQFYAGLGFNAIYNYGSTSNPAAQDFAISGGYNYSRKGLSVGGSVEFFTVSNMNSVYQIKDVHYGLRSFTTFTNIATKNLQFLAVNPEVGMYFLKKNHLSLGYGLEFLVSGKNQVAISEVRASKTNEIKNYTDRNYIEGFNSVNHSLFFNYTCSISKHYALGLKYNIGLSDITKNSYFNDNKVDKNNRLVITFKYKF